MSRYNDFFNSDGVNSPSPSAGVVLNENQLDSSDNRANSADQLSVSTDAELVGEPSFSMIDTDLAPTVTGKEAPTVDSASPSVPTSIVMRPKTLMKARFSGDAAVNDLMRRDWQRAIAEDPMAFDALLYVPSDASATESNPDDEDGDENNDSPAFTEINANQQTLTYSDPVLVAVLDCPDDRPSFTALDADGENDGGVDDVLILRIAPTLDALNSTDIDDLHPIARTYAPVGSIIEWNEALADGESRCWWYVHRIFTYGTAAVGSLYYCIPARNFDAVLDTPPVEHEYGEDNE